MKTNILQMKQTRFLLLALLLGLISSQNGLSQTLVQYNAAALANQINANIPVFSNNADLTATPITRGAGLTAVAAASALSSTGWPTSNVAPAGSDYYRFTLNANSGFVMDVRGSVLSFGARRTTNQGVTKVYVYTSADNFTTALSTTTINSTGTFNINCTFPNTATYNNLFQLEVRIYGDAAANATVALLLQDPSAGPTDIQMAGGSLVNCIPQLSFISSQPPICDGSDMNLSATFTSPITPTYSWSGPSAYSSNVQSPTIVAATGINSGTYTVTATSSGCGTSSATTTYLVSDITSTMSSTNETCPGSCDGTAIVSSGGGLGQYTFSWSPSGGSAASASGLCNGNYTVSITDGIGCNATNTVAVGSGNCSNSTQLNAIWCGAVNCNLSQTIAVVPVVGATNYEYRFTNNALGYSYNRVRGNGVPNMPVSWILGLQYGYTYNVQVRAYVNNVWQNFGPVCTMSMAAVVPATQLSSTSCGANGLSMSSVIYCNSVAAAQNYEFRITNAQQPYSYTRQRGSGTASIPLSWFPGLQYGRTYDVEVRANVGGDWGNFGPVCTINMQSAIPSPVITTCGGPFATTQALYCTTVSGAQNYEWQFIGPQTYVRQRGNTLTSFYPSSIQGFVPGTYTVSVRAKVGGVWALTYGPSCTIIIGAPVRLQNEEESPTMELTPLAVVLYPNPVGQGIIPTMDIQGADGETATISVVDITGKVTATYQETVAGDVYTTQLRDCAELASGIYFLMVTVGDQTISTKFIVE